MSWHFGDAYVTRMRRARLGMLVNRAEVVKTMAVCVSERAAVRIFHA